MGRVLPLAPCHAAAADQLWIVDVHDADMAAGEQVGQVNGRLAQPNIYEAKVGTAVKLPHLKQNPLGQNAAGVIQPVGGAERGKDKGQRQQKKQ